MSGQYKTYTISGHKVEASDSLITGNNNIIFGNNNRIAGDNNKIYGNTNAIVGNNNVVKGENNIAKGDSNEVYDPFGNAYPQPTAASPYLTSNPFAAQGRISPSPHFFTPPTVTQDRIASPIENNSYARPVPTRERSSTYPYIDLPAYDPPTSPFQPVALSSVPVNFLGNSNAYFQTVPQVESNSYFQPIDTNNTYPPVDNSFQPVDSSSYHQQQMSTTYSQNSNSYYQPTQQEMIQFAPQQQQQQVTYIVVASPTPGPPSPRPYVNPFSSPQEKKQDIIQDGTLVFIVNETDAEYVREFCNMVSTNSGQKLGCHISAGRMCLVGLGDLNKIRDTIIQNLPLLNMKLKEWSWHHHGKNVCSDKEVYYKRMFKEYTKEDVDCWRSKPTKIAA
jgi:hypothetical protein